LGLRKLSLSAALLAWGFFTRNNTRSIIAQRPRARRIVPVILDEIIAWKRREVAARKAARPERDLEKVAGQAARRPFEKSLVRPGRLSILAEIKRASPSAGTIRRAADPKLLAASMEGARANALSVLTDEKYFAGSLRDLADARSAVSIPVLEKDFVIDEYQVREAAVAGADAVLLIVRILSDGELAAFYKLAKGLGLGCLVEVHTADDLQRALAAGAKLIGINNRDLATFEVDIETTLALMPRVPKGVHVVSQSGISRPDQVKRLFDAGVAAIQVGESLMRADDPGAKIRELLSLVD
jgi:indole-3-glycerol phosphate synthase